MLSTFSCASWPPVCLLWKTSIWICPFFDWVICLNVRLDAIKLLEENIGMTIDDINQSKFLYDPPPRVMEIKTKVNKWDLIKLKSFYTAKEAINKT